MTNQTIPTKERYEILDGLRGVAAVMVVIFHIFETHATSRFTQIENHGYLAVDFFYVLSGFVIGYAYDDRWAKGMTIKSFFKRRLIRLHPMVVIGTIIGAALFFVQGSFGEQHSVIFPLIGDVSVVKLLLYTILGMLMIPVTTGAEIRGWGENYPLNGPAWTLFLEYIANIMYALFIRKLSNKVLAVFVFIFACLTIEYTLFGGRGDVIGGWSLNWEQMRIGFTRLLYPFFAGLLLSRLHIPGKTKHAFFWCTLFIIAIFWFPRLGGETNLWANGLYEALVIIVVFPFIVWFGASSNIKGKYSGKICKFLGDISYPIYITHYPLIYVYTGWVKDGNRSFANSYWAAILLIIVSILLAYACLKLYDIPVRKWLSKR